MIPTNLACVYGLLKSLARICFLKNDEGSGRDWQCCWCAIIGNSFRIRKQVGSDILVILCISDLHLSACRPSQEIYLSLSCRQLDLWRCNVGNAPRLPRDDIFKNIKFNRRVQNISLWSSGVGVGGGGAVARKLTSTRRGSSNQSIRVNVRTSRADLIRVNVVLVWLNCKGRPCSLGPASRRIPSTYLPVRLVFCPPSSITSSWLIIVDLIQVSWIRRRDWHIMSSGSHVYTADGRFSVLNRPGSPDWVLMLKSPQLHDSGLYECQVKEEKKKDRRRIVAINPIPRKSFPIAAGLLATSAHNIKSDR